MKAKGLIIGMAAIALAAGCKKDDGTGSGNYDSNPPKLFVNGADVLKDTLKYTLSPELYLTFEVEDDRDERTLSMSKLEDGLVYYAGNLINNTAVDISGIDNGQLRFRALEAGTFSFFLTVKDPDEKSSTALVEITALGNLRPQAKMTVQQTGTNSPYEVRINAAGSTDADAAWGGAITQYEYTLEGFYTTTTVRDYIDYIYPEPGRYTIILRVQDNEGAWSEPITKEVVVQ